MKIFSFKKILNWFGNLLSILGLGFVLFKLADYHNLLKLDTLSPSVCLFLMVMPFLYGFTCLLLPIGWQKLLHYLSVKVSIKWSIKAYGVSQLAKYIPGNIFHFVSRQVIGAKFQIPALTLAKSSFGEVTIQSLTAAAFGLLILPLSYPFISETLITLLFLITLTAAILVIYIRISSKLGCAVLSYSMFHVISGTIFVTILILVNPSANHITLLFPSLIGAYVIAWLVGLVIPGAPAGVGVREFILFTLLQFHVSQINLLTAIMIGRMVTVGGDVLFYCLASASYFFNEENLWNERQQKRIL